MALLASASFAGEGAYVLGSLGTVHFSSNLHKDIKDATQETVDEFGGRGKVTTDSADVALKVIAGYRINDNMAIEGGYYYFGRQESKVEGRFFSDLVNVNGKVKITGQMFAVTGVGIFPIHDTGLELFAKGGLGVARVKASGGIVASAFGVSEGDHISKTKTRLVPVLGIGSEAKITDNLAIRAEYERVFNASKNSDDSRSSNFCVHPCCMAMIAGGSVSWRIPL